MQIYINFGTKLSSRRISWFNLILIIIWRELNIYEIKNVLRLIKDNEEDMLGIIAILVIIQALLAFNTTNYSFRR